MIDDPRITMAERYGVPERPTVKCPCCGMKCETLYTDSYNDPFGCDQCIKAWDSVEWFEDQMERAREIAEEEAAERRAG